LKVCCNINYFAYKDMHAPVSPYLMYHPHIHIHTHTWLRSTYFTWLMERTISLTL